MNTKRTICIDFDNTLATYDGWREEGFTTITGQPMPGAKEVIDELRLTCTVFVHSVRCGYPGGAVAIMQWLERYGIVVDGVSINKPRADLYIDDAGLRFEGDWLALKPIVGKLLDIKGLQVKQEPQAAGVR